MDMYKHHIQTPVLVSVLVNPNGKIWVDKTTQIQNQNGRNTILKWCGLIYFEDYHFVTHIIDADGQIWYNDGKSMGHISSINGTLQSITDDNIWRQGMQKLIATVYAQT